MNPSLPHRDIVKAWTVAFAEGFSTLAVEVIAIRLAVPVVGSSIVLTGVMLGVVLLALSAGYWRGGALSASWDIGRTRTVLARNLLLAAVLYGAVAFPLEAIALERLLDAGLTLPLAIGAAAVLLFLLPIYLASQTVPMLAELTNVDGHAGRASGKVLFFSTIGSVAGGIVTPVWLFPSIGVTRTTYIVCALLAGAAAVMIAGHLPFFRMAALGIAGLAAVGGASFPSLRRADLFHFDSAYQTIRVIEEPAKNGRIERVLMMGGGRASGIYTDNQETSFAYAKAVLAAIDDVRPREILVIGAAGFNVPRDAAALPYVERIDAVDVDPAVRAVTEQHFLRSPLPPKIRFLPLSARYAVHRLEKDRSLYGFTLIDAYFGQGIPEELVTVEFFRDVSRISHRAAANVIMDDDVATHFARNLLTTFREAFGQAWYKDVKPDDSYFANMLVTSWPLPGATEWRGTGATYRDDRNSADKDHVALVW
jgi:spermidine synthase